MSSLKPRDEKKPGEAVRRVEGEEERRGEGFAPHSNESDSAGSQGDEEGWVSLSELKSKGGKIEKEEEGPAPHHSLRSDAVEKGGSDYDAESKPINPGDTVKF